MESNKAIRIFDGATAIERSGGVKSLSLSLKLCAGAERKSKGFFLHRSQKWVSLKGIRRLNVLS